MIAFLEGSVDSLGVSHAVVNVGGVGLLVSCPPDTVEEVRVGMNVRLHTSLVVREDAWSLYGFGDQDSKEVFELLQTVSGVGPRLALAALSVLSPVELQNAIGAEDLRALCGIPGVGRKVAQRLVLELKDKVAVQGSPAAQPESTLTHDWVKEISDALVGLGWSSTQARSTVESVAASLGDSASTLSSSQLLRAALRELQTK